MAANVTKIACDQELVSAYQKNPLRLPSKELRERLETGARKGAGTSPEWLVDEVVRTTIDIALLALKNGTWRAESQLTTWVFVIARNTRKDLRKLVTEDTSTAELPVEEPPATSTADWVSDAWPSFSPLEQRIAELVMSGKTKTKIVETLEDELGEPWYLLRLNKALRSMGKRLRRAA